MNKNKDYLKISSFVIFTFFICALIYKVVFQQTVVNNFFSNILGLFSPLIIGIAIAYFLNPVMVYIEEKIIAKIYGEKKKWHKHASRITAVITTYILLFGLITLILNIVMPQISKSLTEIRDSIPYYYDSLYTLFSNMSIKVGENKLIINTDALNSFLKDNLPRTPEQIGNIFSKYLDNIVSFTGSVVNGVAKLFVGLVIALYLLINKEVHLAYLRKILITALPIDFAKTFFKKAKESNDIFLNFITGKLLDSFIIGVLCFIILIIFKIPYPTLISMIVFITNMIPFFGPLIGGAIGVVFLIAAYPFKAITFLIIILILQQFDGNFLGPKILGDSTGLTPIYVIFAVTIFGGIFGILGMFLGVPIFAVIKNIFDGFIEDKYNKKMNDTNNN